MEKAYFTQFSTLIGAQKYDEAFRFTNSLIAKDANNPDYLGLSAVAKFYIKDMTCLADLDKAISLEPDNAYRYSSRAYILDALGDTAGAVNDYLKAIELDPSDLVALNNLGILEEKLGRKQQAESRFNASDELLGLEKKEGRYHFPEKNLQSQLNELKGNSRWSVMKNVFTSRKGLEDFFRFISSKFVKK